MRGNGLHPSLTVHGGSRKMTRIPFKVRYPENLVKEMPFKSTKHGEFCQEGGRKGISQEHLSFSHSHFSVLLKNHRFLGDGRLLKEKRDNVLYDEGHAKPHFRAYMGRWY